MCELADRPIRYLPFLILRSIAMFSSLRVRSWRILLVVVYFLLTKADRVPLFDLEGSGLRGSGDGSGLGSGSGDTINPTVVTPTMPSSCVLPTGNFDPTDKLISSVVDGTLRGQCHAACLEKVSCVLS